MFKIPHHEFWPARWYELPGYVWLVLSCLLRGIGLPSLFRANYVLDHGGSSFASKFDIQKALGVQHFPETIKLSAASSNKQKQEDVAAFAQKFGYPIIMKPDYGFTGRGVFKIDDAQQLAVLIPFLQIDYLAQVFVPSQVEFGVFYARHKAQAHILGINQKHFPTVVGDGHSTLQQLVERHERYNHFWHSYLPYHDLTAVLPAGEKKRLSVIGSHTMGCKFTNDTNLVTPELEKAIFKLFRNTPGFNYGRLDVLAESVEAFQRGDFTLVEVNGADALPTNIFDPALNLWQSYRIFFRHLTYLAKISAEQKHQAIQYLPFWAYVKQSRAVMQEVVAQQNKLETMPNISSAVAKTA